MDQENAEPQGPKKPQSDLIIPPAMVERVSAKARSQTDTQEPKRAGPWAYATLILLTILAFGPILKSDLLWTIYDEVERTPFTSMDDWTQAWKVDAIRQHDPITLTSYFAETYSPLPKATTHRLINLFLHLAAALILLKVLESLKLRGAYAAALVFALHPAALQTLYWPGYRHELIGLVFILASLFFGIRNRDLKDFILAATLTCISSLLHSAALALPALIGLCIFFQNKRFHLYQYNQILPLCCIALFAGVWTHSGKIAASNSEDLSNLTIAAQNLYFYLQQSFLPLDLKLFHPFRQKQSYNVGATNSLLAFLIFIPFYVLIAFNYRKRWAKGLFLGLSSYILLLIYGITLKGRFIDGSLAKEDHGLYVALPVAVALTFCNAAGFFGQKKNFGNFLWPIFISFFLLIQIGLTASFSLAVSDSSKTWLTLSKQWENSWQPKAALVKYTQSKNSDFFSESELIRTLEQILEIEPERHRERVILARTYRDARQNTNALREYKRILRDTQPDNEFLKEAADFFDSLNLRWEANNARERIRNSSISQE